MNLKSVFLLLFLFAPLCSRSQQLARKHIPHNLQTESVQKVMLESDQQIIANTGTQNFNSWLDSVSVTEVPYDNGCKGSRTPCDPVPPKLSDYGRIRITYFFTIPGFGSYSNSNYAYQNIKTGHLIFEDHAIFPDCGRFPFKCSFLAPDTIKAAATKLLRVADTTEIRLSYPFYFAGNFAHFFQSALSSVTLSANTGEVLEYKYLGPVSSNNCAGSEKCRFNNIWQRSAEKFLGSDGTFELSNTTPAKRGNLCVWELASGQAYLVLNGKDGTILYYRNYSGPSAAFKTKTAPGN